MKRKNMKKFFGLLMVATLSVGMLAGCGNKTEEVAEEPTQQEAEAEAPAAEEEYVFQDVTVTVSGKQGATEDWNGTALAGVLKEKFGVTLDCTPYPDDEFATKLALAMADETLPDLCINTGLTLAQVADYGDQGYLLPLDEYLEYAPNLKAFLDAHEDYKMYCTSPDGHIYTLLNYSEIQIGQVARNYINESWLKNVGMDVPETIDELYEVLVAFRDQDANGNGDPNDEIPLIYCDTYSRKIEQTILPAFGVMAGGPTQKMFYLLQEDNGTVYLADTTDNYKEYLKFMNKLWEEELLYNESYSIDIKAQRALAGENRLGAFADANTVAGGGIEAESDYTLLGPFTSEFNPEATMVLGNACGSEAKVIVSADTEHPAEVLRMLDYFFTPEGMLDANYGGFEMEYGAPDVAGYEDYDVMLIPTGEDVPDGYELFEEYRVAKLVINNGFNFVETAENTIYDAVQKADPANLVNFKGNDGEWIGAIQEALVFRTDKTVNMFPTLLYSEEVNAERNSLFTDISLYLQTAKAQFITGEVDIEEGWDDYVAMVEQMGLPRLLEIEQEAYDTLTGK